VSQNWERDVFLSTLSTCPALPCMCLIGLDWIDHVLTRRYCTYLLAADDDQCNEVEERPTFVVSNDDIHNLGELLMDGWMDG